MTLEWRGRLREPTATQPWEVSPPSVLCLGQAPMHCHRRWPRMGPIGHPQNGAQNGPLWDPQKGAQKGAQKGPFYRDPPYANTYEKGGPRGAQNGTRNGAPWGAPRGAPGGAKKCTFFWVFNNSPSRDKNLAFFRPPGTGPGGPKWGVWGWIWGYLPGAVVIAPQELRYGWGWCPRGERCDGTLARPYARGGYVALGWAPPSRQGTEVPRRGVAGAGAARPFAIAKRGPSRGSADRGPP